jgi:hypothetical protein
VAATGFVSTDVVTEVNGETGDVDLDAADVGAEASGAAAAAVAAHSGGADPHGDRAYTDTGLAGKADAEGPWADITPATNVGHWSTANAQARTIRGGTGVELSGRLVLSGTVNSGTSWGQLPVGRLPVHELKVSSRSSGTGATGNTVTISTAGAISFGATLNAGAELPLDGLTFRRA